MIEILAKLKWYCRKGGMNRRQIEQIISELLRFYERENEERTKRIQDELMCYVLQKAEGRLMFEDYVHHNLSEVALLLQRSERTIYRKLKNNSFTPTEKKMIQQHCDQTEVM